ncbi:MAG: sigma-70 family RNA polymerase sigma factor [Saprospiraceae bacterium]|nr:sigma-70 family RNA polymerase sigma factor [Candidatus Vicinibacter affinis]MBK9643208.1 sigma-70 family RNA polymerase sigma factor [Candidatus Vicinibacter affinis]MBP6173741.1 sigma-70 family RNA polymerase sigma factor [Saprospiraceae bacterium]
MNQANNLSTDLNTTLYSNDDQIEIKIGTLYKSYFPLVMQYIVNNSGNVDDAKDIFQEVALLYYKICQKKEPGQITNEKYYILGMTKNIWLKKLRDKGRYINVEFNDHDDSIAAIDEMPELIQTNALIDLVLNKLTEISEECRKIIYGAFYLKQSAVEIAHATGYSESFIKVKKYRCLQGLKRLVSGSPDFKNLQS